MEKIYDILKGINDAQDDICADSSEFYFFECRKDDNDNQYTIYQHVASGKFIKIKEYLTYGCDGFERHFQWAKEAKRIPTTTYEYEEINNQLTPTGE